MGMTDNQKWLIRAISENNMIKARQYARICLEEDTTQKNRKFVETYKKRMDSAPSYVEVPPSLKGKLLVEDVSESFLNGRYYTSQREKELFDRIARMKAVSEVLKEKQIPYINATMLYGESGTGKTTFGRYVAYRMGLPFCYLNFSSIIDSLLGKTASNISQIFNHVRTFPCVFMLDEVDCIAINRGSSTDGSAGEEVARVTITLMQEFDRLPNDIIVLGATNRIDKIDPAFLRRFPQMHEVKKLTREETEMMIEQFLEDTDMCAYISPQMRAKIADSGIVQGKVMYQLIHLIGDVLYDANNFGQLAKKEEHT